MSLRLPIAFAAAAVSLASAQQPATHATAFAAPNLGEAGVRAMAANCAICHGPLGRPVAGSQVPALAGRRERGFVDAMREFREGRREATVMHQIARGYTEAEVEAMASYFARQAP
jgi:cytochrome c553